LFAELLVFGLNLGQLLAKLLEHAVALTATWTARAVAAVRSSSRRRSLNHNRPSLRRNRHSE
jgi:hypothetical protein